MIWQKVLGSNIVIWLPINNYYRVHASVLDRSGQHGLYIAQNGLENPDIDIVIPDILVRTYLAGDQYKFAYWNATYWALMERISPEVCNPNRPGKDFMWSRFIVICTREHLDKANRNQCDAYEELLSTNPLG